MDILEQVKDRPPPSVTRQTAVHGAHADPFFASVSERSHLQVPEELVEACEVAMSGLQSDRYESAENLGMSCLARWRQETRKGLGHCEGDKSLAERCQSLEIEVKPSSPMWQKTKRHSKWAAKA